jgi:tRNA pseudouridine32 synthase/23S rRNA pseudouridine746 synthase
MTERLPVLHEDDDLCAVDKPEGLPVIPERIARGPCALEIAAAQTGTRLYVVHRLDRDTSGVLLFAKNAAAHRHLNGEFEHRRARKTYAAVAEGRMAATDGKITAAIRPFGSGRMGVDRRGKPCLTHYRVVGFAGPCTELLAHPVTGRRHQIRVHLYSLGHPIAGDRRYGDPLPQGGGAGAGAASTRVDADRLMLHARSLVVRAPSGAPVRITSELPVSYVSILTRLRGGA